MSNKKKLFLITEAAIYVLFILSDLNNIDSTYLKYAGIILCFLYCLSQRNIIFSMALLFTSISDYFLLVQDNNYIIGISTFIVVQLIYCYYLYNQLCNTYFPFRLLLFVISVIILYLTEYLSLLNVLVSFYFINLVFNFICSLSDKNLRMFSLGLFLFICCDICVGLHNISLNPTAAFLMWVFYLPSQVIISLNTK